jgi:predicted glycosyltransferase
VRVWVDLTNSPHALFFAPVARTLTARGDDVLVTARHFAQTVELAEQLFEHSVPVGSGARSSLTGKFYSLGARVRDLLPLVRRFAPDVAVAHGSYDQPIVSRLLGIPDLTMIDYEYHPGTHLLFRLSSRLLLPEAFSSKLVLSHGGRGKTWRYRGLKEEVYLSDFRPAERQRAELGISDHDGLVVTLRPPAVGAMYHRHDNALWTTLTTRLQQEAGALTLVLPRHPSQVAELRSVVGAPNVRVLDRPIDGPALIWWSDAVISAGGTMNREAVALGTPAWSVFSGRLGAVDAALIAAGRLGRLSTVEDLRSLTLQRRAERHQPALDHDVLGQTIAAIDKTALLSGKLHFPSLASDEAPTDPPRSPRGRPAR